MGSTADNPDYKSLMSSALVELEAMEARVLQLESLRTEPIAIIGMGCRYPGAPDLDSLWRVLINGTDAVREVPSDRWDLRAIYDPDPDAPGKTYARHGGFVDHLHEFDAHSFSITPREAASLD